MIDRKPEERVSGSEPVDRTSPEEKSCAWKNTSATDPVPLTIDGHPALQDEVGGTEKGTNIVFLHTTVDDGDHFQPRMLLLANRFGVRGTLKSRWQEENQLLHETTATFHSEK